MSKKPWFGRFTENDFSDEKKAERRDVFKAWRESSTDNEVDVPGATSVTNIPTSSSATTYPDTPHELLDLSPLLVRGVRLQPPSSRVRDITTSLPAATSASVHWYQPLYARHRPEGHSARNNMSDIANNQPTNRMNPQILQDPAIDPALAATSTNETNFFHSDMESNSQGSQATQDNNHIAAQNVLPAEAEAEWNPNIGVWYPKKEWHTVEDLDAELLGRDNVGDRLRYLFDFMATPAGGRAFVERIGSNARVLCAAFENINRHVEAGEEQLEIIDGVSPDKQVVFPNGASYRVEGRPAVANKLFIDKYWQDLFSLEFEMSELALARVEVARKATVHLGDAKQGLPVGDKAGREMEGWYGQFQDMREQMVKLLVKVLKRVGDGPACSDMLVRHRNELWDVWDGRSTPDAVL